MTLERMIHGHRQSMKDILCLIKSNRAAGREMNLKGYIQRYLIHYETLNSLGTILVRKELKKIGQSNCNTLS